MERKGGWKMEKHIEKRREKIHDAMSKHWGEPFTLSIYKSNGTPEEVQTSINTDAGDIYLYIGKDYVHLLALNVFHDKLDYEFTNQLNAMTLEAKYIGDDNGAIRAEKRLYTGDSVSERVLVENIRRFTNEIESLKNVQTMLK